ncbi:helix-turn-helix domain-containing protein [Pelotomaculum terephthalicicum]
MSFKRNLDRLDKICKVLECQVHGILEYVLRKKRII